MICNFDLVSGWKKKRYDSVVAKTYLLNLHNASSGVQLNDFNQFESVKNVVVKR
jgi:hypothetical protein